MVCVGDAQDTSAKDLLHRAVELDSAKRYPEATYEGICQTEQLATAHMHAVVRMYINTCSNKNV